MFYPISYAFPDHKILKEVTTQIKEFFMAPYLPGMAYAYETEEEYLACYKKSVFGLTHRKSGWDCWRHVEIMSQGCFPYMLDIDKIPANCMALYPKQKMKFWMDRYGQQELRSIKKYSSSQLLFDINDCLQETRDRLSGTSVAKYVLSKLENPSSMLYIPQPTYQVYIDSGLLYGLKHTLGKRLYESETRPSLYTNFPLDEARKLYGKGMNYTRILDPSMENLLQKSEILEKIKTREFEAIFWADIHKSIDYLDVILNYYDEDELAFMCENDCDPLNDPDIGWTSTLCHTCHFQPMYASKAHFFVRELDVVHPYPPPPSKEQFFYGMANLFNRWRSYHNIPPWTGTALP